MLIRKWSDGLRLLDRWQSVVEDVFSTVGGIIIVALIAMGVTEIAGRYFRIGAIPGRTEISDMIMGALVFCGLAYTQRIGGHIMMDLFVNRVLKGRSYWLNEFFNTVLALAGYSIITIYSLKNTISAYQVGYSTGYLLWPTWPFMVFVPIGSFLLCIRFVLQLHRYMALAVAGAGREAMVEAKKEEVI